MADDAAYYLHVTIQLVRGRSATFYTAMSEMAPVLEEAGWRLVGAFTPTVGRLNAVFHVWSVPSPDGVLVGMNAARSHPSAMRWHDMFAESIEDEVVQLVRPTPYSRTP
jgi:hypothetical protein